MDIDQLRTFLAVLEHRSFSRAAEALRVGQSTVSFHVKALETAAAARLLDRRGGRVSPTASGRVLRRYAERVVGLRDEALARLRQEERGESGQVRIAASTIPAEYLLPPVLAKLRRERPAVAITVEVSDSRKAVAAVLAEECDVALVGAPVRDKRLAGSVFAHDEVILVGTPRAPFFPSGAISGRDLQHLPLVVREEGSGTREAIAALLARRGASVQGLPASIQVGSTEAARRCALHGVGLTFLSRHAVAEDLRAGRLRVVRLPGTPVRRRLHAVWLRSVTLPAAARLLLRLLVRAYR